MNTQHKIKMTADQFLAWGEKQSEGHYELVDGEIVRMAPERIKHVRLKYQIARAIEDAITLAKLDYEFLGDGASIRIDEHHVRIPDGCIAKRPAGADESLEVAAPIVVFEVTSPSTERDDAQDKLAEYFSVPSVEHYLIINPWRDVIVHHRRQSGNTLQTRILRDGVVDLSPIGLTVAIQALLGQQ